MRPDNIKAANPIRPRRGAALLITTGAALVGSLLAAVPAQAASTTKTVSPDGTSVVFQAGSDKSKNVEGSGSLTLGQDGNWQVAGSASNKGAAGRTYHWTCTVTWGSESKTFRTDSEYVPTRTTRSTASAAFDPAIQEAYPDIIASGQAVCDIVIG